MLLQPAAKLRRNKRCCSAALVDVWSHLYGTKSNQQTLTPGPLPAQRNWIGSPKWRNHLNWDKVLITASTGGRTSNQGLQDRVLTHGHPFNIPALKYSRLSSFLVPWSRGTSIARHGRRETAVFEGSPQESFACAIRNPKLWNLELCSRNPLIFPK